MDGKAPRHPEADVKKEIESERVSRKGEEWKCRVFESVTRIMMLPRANGVFNDTAAARERTPIRTGGWLGKRAVEIPHI